MADQPLKPKVPKGPARPILNPNGSVYLLQEYEDGSSVTSNVWAADYPDAKPLEEKKAPSPRKKGGDA